jgi:hypothetical protein
MDLLEIAVRLERTSEHAGMHGLCTELLAIAGSIDEAARRR